MAFNAKNLHYEKQEPAFLKRLRSAHDAQDGRHNVQFARPQKSRLKMGDGDEDDGPTIVDETGEIVGMKEYERRVTGAGGDGLVSGDGDGNDDAVENKVTIKDSQGRQESTQSSEGVREGGKQAITEVGGKNGLLSKKRKQGRVVHSNDHDNEDDNENSTINNTKTKSTSKSPTNGGETAKLTSKQKSAVNESDAKTQNKDDQIKKKMLNKKKRIKLSFDEGE